MSGGHFDYKNHYIYDMIEQIETDIKCDNSQLSELTIEFMQKTLSKMRELSEILYDYDYMMSGDSSEDTFKEKYRL
jgi:hypothetical protein